MKKTKKIVLLCFSLSLSLISCEPPCKRTRKNTELEDYVNKLEIELKKVKAELHIKDLKQHHLAICHITARCILGRWLLTKQNN